MSAEINVLLPIIGKTLVSIDGAKAGSGSIRFLADDGSQFLMWHYQDCCENVSVENICGDVADLIGTPIVDATETESDDWPKDAATPDFGYESYTWTFYRFSTIKGTVVIRWYGESNGYYSERVEFAALQEVPARVQ